LNGRNIALADFITRTFHKSIQVQNAEALRIDRPGQQVLQRSSVLVNSDWVEARINISLPARGRTILGSSALHILMNSLPGIVQKALFFKAYDRENLDAFVASIEDQDILRSAIVGQGKSDRLKLRLIKGYSCFVPNGAILPRESGASAKPLPSEKVIRFQSPPSLEKTFNLPNRGSITGMAIPQGMTTIVGGGYHGKSTLLKAISLGVWNHIPGDGREFTVTEPTAVGVKSEDGRSVTSVDISPFINNLPGWKDTHNWSTDDASGSTSMAASVVEVFCPIVPSLTCRRVSLEVDCLLWMKTSVLRIS
jgi:predicted ABC-class ATPase